jgi:hypothetical protein
MKKVLLVVILLFPLIIQVGCTVKTTGPKGTEDLPIVSGPLPPLLMTEPGSDRTMIPSNTLISALFAAPVDAEAVKGVWSYSYGGRTFGIDDGICQWSFDHCLMMFKPSREIPIGEKVQVFISTSAYPVQGSDVGVHRPAGEGIIPWEFTITDEAMTGTPRIVDWSSRERAFIPPDAELFVEYDREMLRCSAEVSFTLFSKDDPEIRDRENGKFRWSELPSGHRRMTYLPDTPLVPDCLYTLSFDSTAFPCLDLAGNSMETTFRTQFQTLDEVVYVSAAGSDENIGNTRTLPIRTIERGLEVAWQKGYTILRISEGSYDACIDLTTQHSGMTIEGAWNTAFETRDPVLHLTEVLPEPGCSYPFTITSDAAEVTLRGMRILGGGLAGRDNGSILINGNATDISIVGCTLLGATAGSAGYGMRILSGGEASLAENPFISGGTNSGKKTGVCAGNGSWVLIRDNAFITGGSTSNGDTSGIVVEGGSSACIVRNTIVGGEEYSGVTRNNSGVEIEGADRCVLIGNFITGGGALTHVSNNGFAVSVSSSNPLLINNTLNGGGTSLWGATSSCGVYLRDRKDPWDVEPVLINNIIIGGRNLHRYGIYFDSGTLQPPLTCILSGNTFRTGDIYLAGTTLAEISNPQDPDSTLDLIGQPLNSECFSEGDVRFPAAVQYDYHIDLWSPNPLSVKNNGSDLEEARQMLHEYGLSDQLFIDIDGTRRSPASIDRGAHEFSP